MYPEDWYLGRCLNHNELVVLEAIKRSLKLSSFHVAMLSLMTFKEMAEVSDHMLQLTG